MAVTHWIQLSYLWLDPGAEVHWWWNNADDACVYAVNASPVTTTPYTMEAEVIRFWRAFKKPESEVHWRIKNTSSVGGSVYQFMSAICP
jgi:hypothetical protein